MNFVQKLRGEFVDIVEWVDDSRHTLVWRFPRFHNQIKNGAQLIVRPGQTAVFVHEGKVADRFEPGTHVLKTSNLPILSTLKGWKHGFDSPFKAEIYFVATRQITELKWGTPNPVILRDPDFGPVRLRAFGAYTLRASDPVALLGELVGTDSEFEAEEIGLLLRSIINTTFADLIAASGISVVDLASNYAELSRELRERVVAKVDDEYGLEIPQLFIVNISVPEELEAAIDSRSSMGLIGDLDAYRSYQLGRSIPVAAENPAGALGAAGVGIGMGMAYAQGLPGMGAPGVAGARAASAGTPAPPAIATVWYYAEGNRPAGPFSETEIVPLVTSGRVAADTLVWCYGMDDWTAASEVPVWNRAFGSGPPPIPGPPQS